MLPGQLLDVAGWQQPSMGSTGQGSCALQPPRSTHPITAPPPARPPPCPGHETTAAVCTWTLFCLMQNEAAEAKVLAEIDAVVGDRVPSESLGPQPFVFCLLRAGGGVFGGLQASCRGTLRAAASRWVPMRAAMARVAVPPPPLTPPRRPSHFPASPCSPACVSCSQRGHWAAAVPAHDDSGEHAALPAAAHPHPQARSSGRGAAALAGDGLGRMLSGALRACCLAGSRPPCPSCKPPPPPLPRTWPAGRWAKTCCHPG